MVISLISVLHFSTLENIVFSSLFFGCFAHPKHGILVLWLGLELFPPAVEAWVLTTAPTREAPEIQYS